VINLKATVTKLTKEKAVIEIKTSKGMNILVINETPHGHSYNVFAEWDITDSQYERIEELADDIMRRMEGSDDLEVIFDL